MKKFLLVLVIFAVVSGATFAMDLMSYPPPVDGGNIMIDAGLGLRTTLYSGAKWKIPPLFLHVEYALPVGVPISVGGFFTISKYGTKWTSYNWAWTDMTFGARGNWHWGFDVSWLDFYTGLSLGYTYSKWDKDNWTGTDYSYGGFYYAFQAGAHFYFTNNIGAMLEVGYPYWIKAGVAFKF